MAVSRQIEVPLVAPLEFGEIAQVVLVADQAADASIVSFQVAT